MLTRLYIDNYRSFVNFEFRPGPLCLVLGENGAGKSSLFDVMECLRDFISGDVSIKIFNSNTLTRWQSRPQQSFEIELSVHGDVYTYKLLVEHNLQLGLRRVQQESLFLNEKPLYTSQGAKAQLYRDDHSKGPEIPADWSRSGVGFLHAGTDNTRLGKFREVIKRMTIVGLNPMTMSGTSDGACTKLGHHGDNFASWYQAMMLESPIVVSNLTVALRELFPQFSELSLLESGDKRVLKARFSPPHNMKKSEYKPYSFNELSDGQRCLIVLYTLFYVAKEKSLLLFLDEPDNYVAMREIQPWLALLEELCGDTDSEAQVVIASHNSEVVNYLDASRSIVLERHDGWATRTKPLSVVDGLSPAETLARGWE